MKTRVFGEHVVPWLYKEYSSDIHNSGVHLLRTASIEILDLSRIEAGRYELEEGSVSLWFRLLKIAITF